MAAAVIDNGSKEILEEKEEEKDENNDTECLTLNKKLSNKKFDAKNKKVLAKKKKVKIVSAGRWVVLVRRYHQHKLDEHVSGNEEKNIKKVDGKKYLKKTRSLKDKKIKKIQEKKEERDVFLFDDNIPSLPSITPLISPPPLVNSMSFYKRRNMLLRRLSDSKYFCFSIDF